MANFDVHVTNVFKVGQTASSVSTVTITNYQAIFKMSSILLSQDVIIVLSSPSNFSM